MVKNNKKQNVIFGLLAFLSILLFLTLWIFDYLDLIDGNFSDPFIRNALFKIFKRRFIQGLAISISVVLISISSLSFQTITNNRILTPNVLGFDSIFIVIQTLLIAFLGNTIFVTKIYNFFLSVIVMILVVLLMFVSILRKNKNNIVLLLLLGLVLTSLSSSISNFIQVFMHPDDFQSVVSLTNVSINNINETLVFITLPIMLILLTMFFMEHENYNVLSLGMEHSINLGLDYNKKVNKTLILVTISVAISTALIGPLAFLGLIVVNSSKELTKSNKHKQLMIFSSIFSIVIILGGQVILELLNFKTPVTVIINLIGGAYMIYMLLKEQVK